MIRDLALLCSDGAHHDYMVAMMQAEFHVVAVVREPEASQRSRLRHERRWTDYAYASYHHARRTILGLNRYRSRYFSDRPPVPRDRVCAPLVVANINDPQVVALLEVARPDLTVVMGTSIMRADVLRAAGPRIINIHGGWLPDYRGNHCFFFALYHHDFDRIGSTIHFVDRGIDTGDIITWVRAPNISPRDDAEMLYSRAERLAIHQLVDIIRRGQGGIAIPRVRQPFRGRLYRTRDRKIWHDVHHWMQRATGQHRRRLVQWRSCAATGEHD